MTIVKIQKREPGFTILDNRLLNDQRLSWKAKGLLAYLLSKPNDWKVQVEDLVKKSCDGEYAVRTALDELLNLGYATRISERSEDGKSTSWTYTVYEQPLRGFQEVDPVRGFPDVEKPDVENRALNNTDLSNTESTKRDSMTADFDLAPSAPPVRRTVESQKQSTLEALAKGMTRNGALIASIEKAFRISPNWQTKTSMQLLIWLKQRPKGQTVEKFAQWWYSSDWRGKQGQAPTLTQIRELWLQAFPASAQSDPSANESLEKRRADVQKALQLQKILTEAGVYGDFIEHKLTAGDLQRLGVYDLAAEIDQLHVKT